MLVVLLKFDRLGKISPLLDENVISEFRGVFPSYTGLLMSLFVT